MVPHKLAISERYETVYVEVAVEDSVIDIVNKTNFEEL